ncbi:MAG TPA: hypothetical protein DCZ72_05430 [Armatimonadetes bacterium]|nr:hypothetical protein [Armatimonadota bacterium]
MPAGKSGRGSGDMQSAIAQVKAQQDRAARRGKRSGRQKVHDVKVYAKDWIIKLVTVALVAWLILTIDGVRREYADFRAEVVEVGGQVQATVGGSSQTAASKLKLSDGDTVTTGPQSYVTLVLGDGSGIAVEPNSELSIRLLEYARSGRRDRSLLVVSGAVTSLTGPQFGAESVLNIVTPGVRATGRAGALRVSYDPQSKTSMVQCLEGTARASSPAVAPFQLGPGLSARAQGYVLNPGGALDAASKASADAALAQLRGLQEPRNPSGLTDTERSLVRLADPLLSILGIAPGGWGYDAMAAARRSAAQKGLETLRTHIAEQQQPPEVLNPWTLEELRMDDAEKRRLMSAFLGGMLDGYVKQGNEWRLEATSRGNKHTRWMATEAGVRAVE